MRKRVSICDGSWPKMVENGGGGEVREESERRKNEKKKEEEENIGRSPIDRS